MGFRQRFEFGLAWRTIVLVLAMWLFIEALATPGLRAARIVAGFLALGVLASLWTFIRRTNFLLSRFIESVRFEDFSQRFSDPSGGGFDVLGDALDAAIKELQARNRTAAAESRYLSAIVDDAPGALLAVRDDGGIELLNKAARRLFGPHPVSRLEDFEQFGSELAAAARLPAGTRKITRIVIDGVPLKAIFASARVARLDTGITILSLLPVQSELGALEVAAQADLVRVLTHEIMNSLTPVTSLARSGAELVAAAEHDARNLAEARIATETVARRAEGILRFVESYREFAQAPEVHRKTFAAGPWAEEILQLARAAAKDRPVDIDLELASPGLKINADPELLAQALLNLLRNAIRATGGVEHPVVRCSISRGSRGEFRIEVRDNGPGIPADRREDIFLPFYTTHQGGSGVGLSFARQVVLAHGGSISASHAPEGGASLQMVI